MTQIGEVCGVKIFVDAVVPSNEAWLLTDDQMAILKEINRLRTMLECSGIRLTGILVVAD